MKSITWVVGVAGILALLSFVILFLITPSPDRGQLPSAAFGTIIAACVAGVAALAATESVGSRRRYETQQSINERRKVEYDKAILQMVSNFSGKGHPFDEYQIRAMLSTWASADVIVQYRKFTNIVNEIGRQNPGVPDSVPRVISDEIRPKIQRQVGAVAAAMREDLMSREGFKSSATADQIAGMIFNDYRPQADNND
jgi:hypothetical protein